MSLTTAEQPGLYSLVYTSTASRPLAKRDLEHILSHARERNQQENVTGLLLFTQGKFMQYLEGPKSGVLKIFDLIKKSSLHEKIVQVSTQDVNVREYGDWSMAFLADVDAHALPVASQDESLQHGLQAQPAAEGTAAHSHLADFWNKP